MKQLSVLTLILIHLLCNFVWAASHVEQSDDHGHDTPHIHLLDQHTDDLDSTQNPSQGNSDHNEGTHIHVCLHVLSLQPRSLAVEGHTCHKILVGHSQYLSHSTSPPVPPPNA